MGNKSNMPFIVVVILVALLDLGVALGQNLSHVIGTCCMGLVNQIVFYSVKAEDLDQKMKSSLSSLCPIASLFSL